MSDLSLTDVGGVWQKPPNEFDDMSAEQLRGVLERESAPEPDSTNAEDWPEPEPLGSELPPVPAFDSGLLPEVLRPLVEDVAERMQVPLDFPAVAAIATLAGMTNRRALIQPKRADCGWIVVPNLWGAIVAEPGMMKSPVIAAMTAPARAIEAQWRSETDAALEQYEIETEKAELEKTAWKAQYIAAVKAGRDAPQKPESSIQPPVAHRLLATDVTFEALHALLAENPAGLFVSRDELTGWLAGLERQGRESERAFYLESWNGDSGFTIDRIGRGTVHVEHVCVSLFGGIQPARLRGYLAEALHDGPSNDGLIQRFQLLVWPDAKAGWRYVDRQPDARAADCAAEVYRRIAAMDAERPLRLKFDDGAQEMFAVWLADLEKRIRNDGTSPFLRAHLAKYRSLMPSLALLFSLADGVMELVSLHHAQLASDWCDYLEAHARRVYSAKAAPEKLAAIALSRKLSGGWHRQDRLFTIRDVYRPQWSGLTTPDEARAALKILEDGNWVRRETLAPATGRPSEVYLVNPKLGVTHAGK